MKGKRERHSSRISIYTTNEREGRRREKRGEAVLVQRVELSLVFFLSASSHIVKDHYYEISVTLVITWRLSRL